MGRMPPRNCLPPPPPGTKGADVGMRPLELPSAGLAAEWGKVYSGGAF